MKLNNTFFKDFILAAGIRALRTGAQTLLSLITVGTVMSDIAWLPAISATCLAMIISLLTSVVTGLPEVDDK